jgi:DNA polymerase III alpha subunit
MKTNKFGEIIYSTHDVCDLIMQGKEPWNIKRLTVDPSVNLETAVNTVENVADLITWTFPTDESISVPDYDAANQSSWHMPEQYQQLDIAAHILDLCKTDAELQRVGEELLLYQERGLFDLLRYLKYLVDIMTEHRIIWGVGRGSSVASYVLYLLGVHRIDSMFYDLDPREFLR